MLEDQLLDRGDGALGLAQVVLADQHQFAPVNAALLVQLVEVDLDPVHGELAVDVDRAGERPERAHLDLGVGDALDIGRLRADDGSAGRHGHGRQNGGSEFHLRDSPLTKYA